MNGILIDIGTPKTLKALVMLVSLSFLLINNSCTATKKSSTQQRIEKQKKRQHRNPNDCPRIDC